MNNLPIIIGPAPSEMSFEDFREKLKDERERVRRGLEYFRAAKGPKSRSKRPTGLTKLLGETGLTQAQLLKGIELLKQQTPLKGKQTNE